MRYSIVKQRTDRNKESFDFANTGKRKISKSYQFIINPKSGSNFDFLGVKHFRDYICAKGGTVRLNITDSLIHARELAAQGIAEGVSILVVGGGDGTVRSVIEAAAGSNVPILIIPMGTENLLARELGLDDSWETTFRTLEFGFLKDIDICQANNMYFTSIAGIGFEGDVIRRINRFRSGHITRKACLWPIIQTFWQYGFPHLRVEADGKLICDEPALVSVANVSQHVVGIKVNPQADCCDGLLDLCVFRCHHRLGRLLFWLMLILGKSINNDSLVRYRCQKIIITSSEYDVPVQLDGEPGPSLPLQIELISSTARVLAPKSTVVKQYW